jgi:hypothetical protein
MTPNNITEKIILYLDGELPQHEETELFTELASNEELRNIMREHLTIQRFIQKDTEILQPPPSATLNILSSIGISIDSLQDSNYPIAKPTSRTKKYAVPALLIILSSLVTFLTTYFVMHNQSNNKEVAKTIVQTPPIIISSYVDNTPISTTNVDRNNQRNTTRYTPNRLETPSGQTEAFASTPYTPRAVEITRNTANATSNRIENIDPRFTNSVIFSDQSTSRQLQVQEIQPKNIYFTLRGMTGKSFPNPNIEQMQSNKILSNASVGLYFTQWDNIKFGIEFGNEIFGLSYLNVSNGIEYTYEQKPQIYWGAVGIDYTFPYQILNISQLHPFTTALAGGTQIGGPLMKGIIGIRYRPMRSNFEFYLGAEGTFLFYQNQKNYYLTRKVGLTYGMSIIF